MRFFRGSSLSLQAACRLEPLPLVFGNAQFDAIVPVLGVATMGVSMSLRSPARLDPSPPTLDFASTGSTSSLRSFAHLEAATSTSGSM
ncbi:unnamed protein product [Cladocopium goreaui]|uniref:Uncharacterized protein n=1 Tax=Cladocopium goreaui TaxID=2562237 RepID=A0A9P1D156_9DINO|nr:unnamed protein product [Cladocopium goreaui]